MPIGNIDQEFRLKKIDEIRNYLIEEKNQNKLINKKHKKSCKILNYINHLLIVICTITGCVYISVLASLVGIPIGISSFAVGLNICAITAGIKKYKSIVKKKKKKYNQTVLSAKSKLNSIEVLISKALTDSNTSKTQDLVYLINRLKKEFHHLMVHE